jgi:hypothetical protein
MPTIAPCKPRPFDRCSLDFMPIGPARSPTTFARTPHAAYLKSPLSQASKALREQSLCALRSSAVCVMVIAFPAFRAYSALL